MLADGRDPGPDRHGLEMERWIGEARMPRPLKPATPFAVRLVQARGTMTRDEAAHRLGCLKDTLGDYERGRTFPNPEVLTKMQSVYGVSLDWLITGRNAPASLGTTAPPPRAPDLDDALLGDLAEGVMTVFRDENTPLTPRRLVQTCGRFHADLVAAYETEPERRIGAKVLLEQLRRTLRQQRNENASTPRSDPLSA
jgi:putative transcriptional regulator